MPPPPAIGSVRSPKGEAPAARAGESPDDGATARWTAVDAEIAEDDGPSDEAGSRSLPVAAMSPRMPPPPEVSSESSGLRVPTLGPSAAGDSAASWPKTDGWDIDEPEGSNGESTSKATPGVMPSIPKPSASIPKVSAKEPGSVPSVPKPAAKEPGSVPSVPKPAAKETGSVPSIPKPAAKEPGSVPSVPRLGSVPKVAPLPKLGGARPTPASKRASAAEDAEDVKPLFNTSPDGSLAASPTPAARASGSDADSASPLDAWASFSAPSVDAAAIDASAPPSSASPLDALPSFDAAPASDGAPQDGVPSMDSSALLGVALEPVPFEPGEASPSVPRLPIPGMLRDGLAPAADFRAIPRTPRSPQPGGAMPPPKGMVPPKLGGSEEEPRLRPGDTMAFVAQAAEELVEEAERHRAEQAAAKAAAEPKPQQEHERAAGAMAAGGPSTGQTPRLVMFASESGVPPTSYEATRAAETKRRSKLLGLGLIGVAAVIGLFVWMGASDNEEPPTQTAASTVSPASPETPAADGGPAGEPEPPAPSPAPVAEDAKAASAGELVEPEPVPVPVPADAASTSDSGATGEGDTGEVDAVADSAATPSEPEPVEAASNPGSSSRKSSGRKSGGSGKSSGDNGGAAKPEPTPAAKPEEAPSAAKLLKQARSAYNAGKGSSAYSLASKSNRLEPSGDAAEVMALAACQMNDAAKAKAALRTVPLFSRTSVRNTCKTKHGVKLGI